MSAARAALAALAVAFATAARAEGAVIEDDWERALAVARARGAPILVDVWAPW